MRLSTRLLVVVSLVFAACPPPPATESLAISPASLSLAAGETRPLTAEVKSGTTASAATGATWTSSDETIVTVSSAGDGSATVQGLSPGTATVTAKLRESTASVSVTVSARFVTITRIELTPATATLAKGTSLQLAAIGVFSDGTTADITSTAIWTSAAPSILTVDAAGLVRGLSAGATQVSVAKDGISATLSVTVSAATLVAIDVTPALPSLARGTTQQLAATGRFSDTTTQDVSNQVTWTSTTEATATVGASGLVSAAELGTTTITATLNAVSGSTTVTVTAATLTAIDVTPTMPVVPRGRTEQLTATGRFSDGTTQDLSSLATWSAAPASVATVDSAGLVTTVAVGSASITATLGAVSGTTTLTVSSAVLVSISVTPSAPSLARGLTRSFVATGLFSDTTTQNLTTNVTWSSSAPGVGSISNAAGTEGLTTAQSIGTTTITATSGAISGSTTLTVTAASVTSLQVAPTTATLPRGLTLQYTATALLSDGSMQDLTTTVTWTTGTASFATISNAVGSEGLLRAVDVGTSTVIATLGTVTANTSVTVTAARLDRIDVTPSAPSVARGRTLQLTATGVYSDATTQNLTTTVTWASTAATVATVSNASGTRGLLTAVNPGSATVSATLGAVVGSQPVTITAADLVSLAVTPALPSIAKGRTQQFTATGTYSDATFQDLTSQVTWTTGTPATATVSNATGGAGLGSALALGTSTVIATLGTVSGNTTLTVTAAELVSIAVTGAPATLPMGRTADLTATGTWSDSSTQNLTTQVTWSSAPVSTLTVSNVAGSVGRITGVAVGTATVTATLGAVAGQATLDVTAAVLESLLVIPAAPSIAMGRTQQFTAMGTYSDTTTANLTTTVTWGSTTPASLTISNALGSQGLASAIAVGTGSITAQSGSITGSTTFTVSPAVLVSIAVGPINASVAKGRTQQFAAVGTFSDLTTQVLTTTVAWTSGTPGIATISNALGTEGLATSASVGTSLITATSGAISGSTTLTVTPAALVSIAVTPATPALTLGAVQQFVATGTYSDLTTQILTTTVTWGSTDALVLDVSSTGLASALTVGTATLSATSGAVTGSTLVTVNSATLLSIAVTPANPSLAKGRTLQFTARGTYSDTSTQDLTALVTWSSTTGATATVSALGLGTAVDVGTTTITATLGLVSGNTGLTVTPAELVSIAITGAPAFLPLGRTATLVATGTYSDTSTQVITSTVTWSSLPVTTFSISGAGVVTALAVGTATVTATLGAVSNGVSIDATPAALESIAVTPAAPSIAKGLTQQMVATGTYSDTTTQIITGTVTWASTDGSVGTVSGAGLATAVNVGTTTLSATSGAVSGNTLLTVGPATLVSIAVTGAPASLPLGRTAALTATGTYSDLSTLDLSALVTWTSLPVGQVTVSSTGVVTAVAIGTPTVTATLGPVSGFTTVNSVAAVLDSIAVTPLTPSRAKGLTQQFTAMGTYSDATTLDLTATVTWASSAGAVTITSGGLATAALVGNSTISATSGTVSGNTLMTVTPAALVSLAVTPANPTMTTATLQMVATGTMTDGTTPNLTASSTWASVTPAVATIIASGASAGLVTAVSQGSSLITATNTSIVGSTTLTVPNPSVTATIPADGAVGVRLPASVSFTFNVAMDPTSLVGQTVAGPCTGTLQLSADDFATCLAFTTSAPLMTTAPILNVIATLNVVAPLAPFTTYKLRVDSTVRSALLAQMTGTFTQVSGFTTTTDGPCGATLMISQVYGAGGNSGALFNADYVELHNPGTTPVNLNGMALQYASTAGSSWTAVPLPNVSVPGGGYFLVRMSTVGANGAVLTPDYVGVPAVAMAAAQGKVALTASAAALPLGNACPAGLTVDFVGYGTGTTCSEGGTVTGNLSTTLAALRLGAGCNDSNLNGTDFPTGAPNPRNASTAATVCACTANETNLVSELDYCALQFPPTINVGTGLATPNIYARVFETGVTPNPGAAASIRSEIGYGPAAVNPATTAGYTWLPAPFNVQVGNDDEYQLSFTAPAVGSYGYTGRFSRDGTNWTYCDLDGAGSNGTLTFDFPAQLGVMTVTP